MVSQKVGRLPFLSFPRRRESSLAKVFWTSAFAGVTTWGTSYEAIKLHMGNEHGNVERRVLGDGTA
jgi:hypothetical protein